MAGAFISAEWRWEPRAVGVTRGDEEAGRTVAGEGLNSTVTVRPRPQCVYDCFKDVSLGTSYLL